MKLLEGKPIAARIQEELKKNISMLKIPPVLASIQVGQNSAVQAYVKSQVKLAGNLGIEYKLHQLNQHISEEELIDFIQGLNADKKVDGIILQMPLPQQIDYRKISSFISSDKDVESMHPGNIGKIAFGKAIILPPTPAAVMELLKETGIDLCGKEVVIVGHSEIVGKPLALMLLDELATVTVCHIGTSKVGKLHEHVQNAEILIVAVGQAELIKGQWLKPGVVVIDVGINRVKEKLVGDVEFEQAAKRASFITPVPGGVGPLTVTMLMRNVVEACK